MKMRFVRPAVIVPLACVSVLAAIAGCYGTSSLPGASASPVSARTSAASDAGPGGEARCTGRAFQPTNTTWNVDVGGKKRAFVVHVPPTYDPKKATPVVLAFHGYRMSPKLQDWLTDMAAKADSGEFVLVYPEGTGSPSSFNGGACCGDAAHDGVDDVAFTRTMLDRLEADLCVDARRVYATGMSNGGFMSHRLACEMSDRIAAIAPVAGVNGAPTCSPARAVPVLHFHGTADPTIPYDGNPARGWRSVAESTEGWATRNGCNMQPSTTLATGDVTCVTYGECRDGADVTLCSVAGGGHAWPGGANIPSIAGQGRTSHAVSANDMMWRFFKDHPMPER